MIARIAGRIAMVAAAIAFGSNPVRAQSPGVLDELKRVAADLSKPGRVLQADDAQRTEQRLAEWKIAPEKLSPESHAELLTVECLVALARGNAALARDKFAELEKLAPQAPATLETGYCVACAIGDPAMGERLLKSAAASATGAQKELNSLRRRWINGLGKKAPEVTIRTEDSTEIDVLRRGDKVLVIDFWNSLSPPPPPALAALKGLFTQTRLERNVEFVGVNAESPSRTPKAMEFAKANGFEWKSRFEEQTGKAPITNEAFHAGSPPWTVVVDSFGFIRATGASNDPGFAYGFRCALAEARGDFEPLLKGSGKSGDGGGEAASGGKKNSASPEKPSNEEAASIIRQARAFWKTGKRTDAIKMLHDVVNEYPGTPEAREAADLLVNWEQQP